MASITYDIRVNNLGAIPPLKKLQAEVTKTTSMFKGLNAVVGAFASVAAVRSVINYADAIDDLSKASGLAIANIVSFRNAVQANGGSAEGASNAISKFNQTLGDARTGSGNAQDTLLSLGITLSDLGRLDEQQLFDKTLDQLSKIQNSSIAASKQADIFGKTLKGVSLANTNNAYKGGILPANATAQSIQDLAKFNDTVEKIGNALRDSLIRALAPITKFVQDIPKERLDKITDAIVNIGGALVGLASSAKAISILSGALTASSAGLLAIKVNALLAGKAVDTIAKTAANSTAVFGGFLASLHKMALYISATFSTAIFGVKTQLLTFGQAVFGVLKEIIPVSKAIGTGFTHQIALLGRALAAITVGGFQFLVALLRLVPGIGAVVAALYTLNEISKAVFDKDLWNDWVVESDKCIR